MRDIEEIKKDPRLRNIQSGIDGFKCDIHIGGWDGSFILSTGAGFEHVSVSPYAKRITPSWNDMCAIKDMVWNDDEAVIQIHPAKENYVNNIENCLHLWRCIYKETPLPPSCLVGIREGQTIEEFKKEVKEAYEIADRYNKNKKRKWADIKGYEGIYQISNFGEVKSLARYDGNNIFREEIYMKPILSCKGYCVVTLRKNGEEKQKFIHRLVAQAFIPNPNNYPMINHKDEDKTNNFVDNLEWCDVTYNNNYGTRLSKVTKKLGHPVIAKNVLTGEEEFFYSINMALNKLNMSRNQHIIDVIKGKRKTCCNRVWRYASEQEIREAYEMAGEVYE